MAVDPPRPGSPTEGSPELIGRYELVTELGKAALGPLWAARVASGIEEGRLVSVRRIALRGSDESLRLLTAAGITAMRVRDPKIVAVLDVARVEGEVLVASEYVDGESLRTLMQLAMQARSPIPAPVALRIGLDVLRAVRASKERWTQLAADSEPALASAAYGGLSPDNIMIASFGESLLSDVGIAGTVTRLPTAREKPDLVCYRAPEQLKTGSEPPDERSDVFTVGIVLWEMLANQPLFRGTARSQSRAEADAVARRVLGAPAELLDRVTRAGAPIPAAAIELVARALERAREARPSVDAMIAALRSLPASAVARPEQLAVTFNQLARPTIQARHAMIELAFGKAGALESQPPSGRSTFRPAAPPGSEATDTPGEVEPGVLPPLKLDGLEDSHRFFRQEEPTRPHMGAPFALASQPSRSTRSRSKPNSPALALSNPVLPATKVKTSEAALPAGGRPEPAPAPKPTPSPLTTAHAPTAAFVPRDTASSMPVIEVAGPTANKPASEASAPQVASSPPPRADEGPSAPAQEPVAPRSDPTSDSETGIEASLPSRAATARQTRARAITIGVVAVVALVGVIAIIRSVSHSPTEPVTVHKRQTPTIKKATASAPPSATITEPARPTTHPSPKVAVPEPHETARPSSAPSAAAPADTSKPAVKKKPQTERPKLHWPPSKPKRQFRPHGI